MLWKVAAFEFRYQLGSLLFRVVAVLLLLGAFTDMAVFKLVKTGGGNVLYNSPHAVIVVHLMVSLLFLFVGAAFVSNAVLRDSQTGFGPLIRATPITKSAYLGGRFLAVFGIGAVILAMATLGSWLGTLLPFANRAMLGPNHLAGFALGYGLFALPNVLIISAILFALAAATRSMAGTFVGVIVLLIFYLVGQRLMEGQTELATVRVFADPFGVSAYMASSRYLTAVQLNAGAIPISGLLLQSRLLWVALALACLAITYRLFSFTEPATAPPRAGNSRDRNAEAPAQPHASIGTLPNARFGAQSARAQFLARLAMEMRFVVRSPLFLILLALAVLTTFPGLWSATGWMDVPLYPLASVLVPNIEGSFATVLVVVAAFYGGELVWRERERRINEIVDAAPLEPWALMLPKMLGLALVLVATLCVGVAMALLVQALKGGVPLAPGQFLLWCLLPMGVDAILVAVLAVFLHALSPSKYAGWGVMVLYIGVLLFGPGAGLENPLWIYGRAPGVPFTDMAGQGNAWAAAWWFRLFWAAVATLLMVAAHLLWPRGTAHGLKTRLRLARTRLTRSARLAGACAAVMLALSGGWIVYNTLVLNDGVRPDPDRYLAEYEQRYFKYAALPQPVVRHVELNVALYPERILADVRGSYRLVNETDRPIEQVHVRLLNSDIQLLGLDLPGARLERDDPVFHYRIYRFDHPMQPGEARVLRFHTRLQQVGFRASGTQTSIVSNGTQLDTVHATPRIGMSDLGLLEDPSIRRKYGLPERAPFPRLDDLSATYVTPNSDLSWTSSSITVSTSADQVPVAPGRRAWERVQGGRRSALFVSEQPMKNLLSINSGRFAVKESSAGGITYRIYFDPRHAWNVDRMMKVMQASIGYYSRAFGPYQFTQLQVVERPDAGGGHAYPGILSVGEGIFEMDLRDPGQLDMVSMLTAHEIAHQWWGHQVTGARMQGGSLLYETLSQYSALMVLRRLEGEAMASRFLRFQIDRYLAGRRTQVLQEQPLVSASLNQDYINYGKGALALYFLQHRIGEDAVNRALRRFVDRYRFSVAPYPRSLDLIALLREEAKTPADQALITDLFERITLYDLKVVHPTAVKRLDGKWDVTVPVEARKLYADGKGEEHAAPLDEPIEVGLFTADPGELTPTKASTLTMVTAQVHSGKQILRFVTAERPAFAGVDPHALRIDRNLADNVAPIAD
ncbi:M1 family aminopeptidase [Dyella sp.]|jgi:hypothetical protein|uniref:M1 family aminopeptidase n=1 Tax=Dyella sp. TaxID=1869338 RepID=UPI002D795B5B|nr:M1 family aminopeptidase [Dyella sp.]HET6431273.1 M1 family aminopeptidase [Dyella sp.]